MSCITLFTDGGSRGNPGPSACSFVVEKEGITLYSQGVFLGTTTNNVAEYTGLVKGLEWIVTNVKDIESLRCYLDSELVVFQMNGKYKIKHPQLLPLAAKVFQIISKLRIEGCPVEIIHCPREKNKLADSLVNQTLDSSLSK